VQEHRTGFASFVEDLYSQASHDFQAVLLEDGGDVGLGHVISEGAVSEDDSGVSSRIQFLVPCNECKSQRLHVSLRDRFG
jgi:hypothetical protein